MSKGEQEEQLREYSALGNIKAVKALLSLGVNPNAANVVNGWTAFHWACKRGHVNIVELLLLHGVDIELKNNQSQTGYQLTKSQQILEILGKSKIEINVQADRQSFIPNYLANPDYDKVWNLPQDLPLDKSSQSDVKKFKEDIPITKNDNLNPIDFNTVSGFSNNSQTQTTKHISHKKLFEIIVYCNVGKLIGAVYLTLEDDLNHVRDLVNKEIINNSSVELEIYKINHKGKKIPISTQQYYLKLIQILDSEKEEELYVIVK